MHGQWPIMGCAAPLQILALKIQLGSKHGRSVHTTNLCDTHLVLVSRFWNTPTVFHWHCANCMDCKSVHLSGFAGEFWLFMVVLLRVLKFRGSPEAKPLRSLTALANLLSALLYGNQVAEDRQELCQSKNAWGILICKDNQRRPSEWRWKFITKIHANPVFQMYNSVIFEVFQERGM